MYHETRKSLIFVQKDTYLTSGFWRHSKELKHFIKFSNKCSKLPKFRNYTVPFSLKDEHLSGDHCNLELGTPAGSVPLHVILIGKNVCVKETAEYSMGNVHQIVHSAQQSEQKSEAKSNKQRMLKVSTINGNTWNHPKQPCSEYRKSQTSEHSDSARKKEFFKFMGYARNSWRWKLSSRAQYDWNHD